MECCSSFLEKFWENLFDTHFSTFTCQHRSTVRETKNHLIHAALPPPGLIKKTYSSAVMKKILWLVATILLCSDGDCVNILLLTKRKEKGKRKNVYLLTVMVIGMFCFHVESALLLIIYFGTTDNIFRFHLNFDM